MQSIVGTALMGRLVKYKLIVALPRFQVVNFTELLTEKINNTWYFTEDREISTPGHEVYIRLYFESKEAKDIAKGLIDAEISGKGFTG